jgi:hypothetical protein
MKELPFRRQQLRLNRLQHRDPQHQRPSRPAESHRRGCARAPSRRQGAGRGSLGNQSIPSAPRTAWHVGSRSPGPGLAHVVGRPLAAHSTGDRYETGTTPSSVMKRHEYGSLAVALAGFS